MGGASWRWQGMRRLRTLPPRTDIKVTASGWSPLWRGMAHSLPSVAAIARHASNNCALM
jgi:hypothetical protein